MMLIDVKTDTPKTTLSQLLLGTEKEGNGTFSKMLKELALQKTPLDLKKMPIHITDGKTVATGKAQSSEKAMQNELLTLLKSDEHSEGSMTALQKEMQQLLNPKLAALPAKELVPIIQQAKSFLKTQIREVQQIKELPKTLGGLIKLAEKIGIDVSKITLAQIQPEEGKGGDKNRNLPIFKKLPAEIVTQELVQNKQKNAEQKTPARKSAENASEPLRSLLHTPVQKEERSMPAASLHSEMKPKPLAQINTSQSAQNSNAQAEPQRTATRSEKKAIQPTPKLPDSAAVTENSKNALAAPAPQVDTAKTAKKTQHTRAAATELPAELSLAKNESATPVAQQTAISTVLSQLLRGTGEENSTESIKAEGTAEAKSHLTHNGIHKAEPLEQKIVEAKQTVRHFAGEIREAVENYKPPFTRIQIKLNPVKLGEVDVTMVQRGNNVHINISSNTAAITTLAQHANELKMQLTQNGLTNATMNFSSGNDQQQQNQQHQQRQHQHAAELYSQFEQRDEQPLLYSQLEIIVPRYI